MALKEQSESTDIITMIIEIIFGLFGALGMGWLYVGNFNIGVLAFIGYLLWLGVELFIISITLGLAACLFVPLNLVIAIVSGIKARDYVRNTGAEGNVLYVILGAIGGLIVACTVLVGLTVVLGGIGALFEGMANGL